MSVNKKTMKKIIGAVAVGTGVAFVSLSILARKQKPDSVYKNNPEQKNPFEGKRVVFVEDEHDQENADGVKGHLEAVGEAEYHPGFYDKYLKRPLDIILSFCGLVVLSPLYAAIAIAIKIDDPGPVLFIQKRVGQNKQFFKLHKFRSMKMSTPHDVPTHMLDDSDQYITRVGRFIRLHSLDEIPQIYDIFLGNMSVIGPRPGLWNQDVLTAERDKYGANDVKPGLTGWAQINGRDELEIPDKARLDGEYKRKISLGMDIKCFLGSLHVFGKDKSVVEGGPGAKKIGRHYTDGKSNAELIGHIGFGEEVVVDRDTHKDVLIVGAGSYIGDSFKTYAERYYGENFTIDTVDTIDGSWRDTDFSSYDIVYYVAGIAHVDAGSVDDTTKEKYYVVNTDLAVEVAQKAKAEGVKEFIFMSSMIVYGESAGYGQKKVVDAHTVPAPANFYGDSKLQADMAVRELAGDGFKVVVLRPPMIYGKGSKGNYPTLAKLARKLPVFPDVDNERSMLHIDNLCEFLCQVMLVRDFVEDAVVLIPQNAEWTKTSQMVKEIAKIRESRIVEWSILKPAVYVGGKMPGKIGGLVNKAFGNSCYIHEISTYPGLDYQVVSLKESIHRTEDDHTKTILFLVNHDVVIYNFRRELVERLIAEGYRVIISSPYGERIDLLKAMGCEYIEVNLDRHGVNLMDELKLLKYYRNLIKNTKPDMIFSYTIKPNLYGALAAGSTPIVVNITGLGTAVEGQGMMQKAIVALYKMAFRKVQTVYLQNEENRKFFVRNNIAVDKLKLLPGSGVNLEQFYVLDYPGDESIEFVFISRIMKEKGIDQYLDAAEYIMAHYPNTKFHICGFCEKEYEGRLQEMVNKGVIIYHGLILDVREVLAYTHCTIHPSFYPEGLSNVLLESSASGRPIITTDRSGCREVIEDGVNGYMIPQQDSQALIVAVEKFLKLSNEERRRMGVAGRTKVEAEFDRQIVVEAYMNELKL